MSGRHLAQRQPANRLQRPGKRPLLRVMDNVIVLDRRADVWSERLERVARDSDRQAFSELFGHFGPLIKAFALSNSGMSSNALAEELVQEVMVKVWTRAVTFDSAKASATTWIYTLARNCRIDLLRRRQRNREQVDVDDLWDLGTEHNEIENQEQQRRAEVEVRDSLRNLPDEQREVVVSVYIEGKSHSETAVALNLPLGTVKSRLRLALSKLKVMMNR